MGSLWQRLGWTLGAVACACGPSLTSVHEGTVRFEHCYRVDLEPAAELLQQRACWELWTRSYTLGQPRDRIEYAERRLRALESADGARPELALGRDEHSEQRQFYLVVPGPTSVHAPPPPIATVVQPSEPLDAGTPPSERAKTGGPKELPAASCADGCQSAWESCQAECSRTTAAECARCKPEYGKCMRRCFE